VTLLPQLMDHPRYQIVRELGRGGMGVVYEAEHKMMHRRVALKIISSSLLNNAEAVARFHSEVENAARLAHPNIVTAHDAEQVGDLHMLVTEYVEGTDLASVLKQRGPLPIADACRYIPQATLGLQHAHEKGMIHRDIKPANLMLTPKGQVKILDFGLARLTGDQGQGEGLTKANAFMGTPEYVAPEQANDARHADIRSDIYSLDCTLYCLLTGRPPFVGATALTVVMAQVEKEPAPVQQFRAAVPAELSAVVMKMLKKDAGQRYQTPLEVARALMPFCPGKGQPGKAKAVSAGGPTVAAEPTPPSPAAKAPARKVSASPAMPLTESARPVVERKRKSGKPKEGRLSRRWLLVRVGWTSTTTNDTRLTIQGMAPPTTAKVPGVRHWVGQEVCLSCDSCFL
jgi:serine/threonine protein kinase